MLDELFELQASLNKRIGNDTQSDLHSMPGEGVSRILYSTLLAENALIARGVSLPFGSSVFAVGRKP